MENLFEKFWFRLMLVLLASVYITELGSIDPLVRRLFTAVFYKEYSATVLITLTVLEIVFFFNQRLDKIRPWHGKVVQRFFLQLLLGLLVPMFIVLGMATLYFSMYNVDILRTDYLYNAFPLVVVLLLLLNFIFIMTPYFILGLNMLRERTDVPQYAVTGDHEPQTQKQMPEYNKLSVLNGNESLLLHPDQIDAAYIVERQVLVRSIEGAELLSTSKLDEVEGVLPSSNFFRVNRQLILVRGQCKGFKPMEYGKLEILTKIPLPVDAIVSQRKAKDFREWLHMDDACEK